MAEDAAVAAGEQLVPIDPAALVGRLRQLRQIESAAELRVALAELGAGLPAPAADDPARIDLPASFLASELAQIAAAQTLERARYYLDRLARGLSETRTNGVNDLNLNRWKQYDDLHTDSLWVVERRDTSGSHSASYWGNFIPQIPNQMIRRFTRPGDWVLDPFVGSGTTLIEAQRLGRNALGIDLQAAAADLARSRVGAEPNPHGVACPVAVADSTHADYAALLRAHGGQPARLAMVHPPYFDIIRFSQDPRDLSNAASVELFLAQLGRVVAGVTAALAPGGHLVLVIGDIYARGEWRPLGFEAMSQVQSCGYTLKSIVVKNFEETAGKRAQKELWRYRALAGGFFVFKHEYLFILRKA